MIKYGLILIIFLLLIVACTPDECREMFPPEEFPMVDCEAVVATPVPAELPTTAPTPRLKPPAPAQPTADPNFGMFDFLTPSPMPTLPPVLISPLATPTPAPTPWRQE